MVEPIDRWILRLRSASLPVLQGTPIPRPEAFTLDQRIEYINAFTDECGSQRGVDAFLLAHVLRVPADALAQAQPTVEPWLEIWSSLSRGRAGLAVVPGVPPIAADPACWALEQESARELAAVHALWYHAKANLALRPALDKAARWLIANVQPDNATNHPWAVHVFADRAARLGDTPEGQMSALYAQQLFHNPLVARGTPDLLSAVIFWDAAQGLESGCLGASSSCTGRGPSRASP